MTVLSVELLVNHLNIYIANPFALHTMNQADASYPEQVPAGRCTQSMAAWTPKIEAGHCPV